MIKSVGWNKIINRCLLVLFPVIVVLVLPTCMAFLPKCAILLERGMMTTNNKYGSLPFTNDCQSQDRFRTSRKRIHHTNTLCMAGFFNHGSKLRKMPKPGVTKLVILNAVKKESVSLFMKFFLLTTYICTAFVVHILCAKTTPNFN